MNTLILRPYIAMKTKWYAFKEDFKNDERGVNAFVATLLILLIVVIMGAVFYEQISTWFKGIMDQIFGNKVMSGGMNEGDFKK